MISVLIPVYNYNVSNLVHSIHKQFSLLNINFEIICINDASTKYFEENYEINKLQNTYLYNLEFNVGRSKIRNLLVKKSKFKWVLFLDADVLPKTQDFINAYVNCIYEDLNEVYCGGIVYEVTKPDQRRLLRWVYGKNREEVNIEIRKKTSYQYFSGANFLIKKSAFNLIKFNESIVKYGYEDVLFADDLKKNNIIIYHIDNPVFHLGLEDNLVFIEKTKHAIENLYKLNTRHLLTEDSIKILKVFQKVKTYKLTWFFSNLYIAFHKKFEYNLKSKKLKLFVFDMYKLTYLCFLANVNRGKVI